LPGEFDEDRAWSAVQLQGDPTNKGSGISTGLYELIYKNS